MILVKFKALVLSHAKLTLLSANVNEQIKKAENVKSLWKVIYKNELLKNRINQLYLAYNQ
jgi:hypothetical protein